MLIITNYNNDNDNDNNPFRPFPSVFGWQRPFPAGSAYLPTPWGWRIPAVVTFQPG